MEVQQRCVRSGKIEDNVLDTASAKLGNSFWLLKSGTGIQVVGFKGERETNQGRRGKEKETQKRGRKMRRGGSVRYGRMGPKKARKVFKCGKGINFKNPYNYMPANSSTFFNASRSFLEKKNYKRLKLAHLTQNVGLKNKFFLLQTLRKDGNHSYHVPLKPPLCSYLSFPTC